MYETEANCGTAPLELIPVEAVKSFGELRQKLLARTVLSWSEHCTECVWPTCYKSCDLYSPREDGRCRRFVEGMVRIDCPDSVNGYLLQIRFKQWGKLWTPGNLKLCTLSRAKQIESRDYRIGTALHNSGLPKRMTSFVAEKRYGLKKRLATHRTGTAEVPTSFVVECYNPTDGDVPISFTFRTDGRNVTIPFQKLAVLNPGFQLVRIPFAEVASVVDMNHPFTVELLPNNIGHEITLYFGLMEFVQEIVEVNSTKCVIWDLDNTIWEGVLVEDGGVALRLKPSIVEIMTKLDRHGVLQSVASKNDHDQAIQMLKDFDIDHFFLYPQISWSPKGQAVRHISRELNISPASILFVDDSEFELQEVKASVPEVRVMHAREYMSLSNLTECMAPVTKEGMSRREMYQTERDRRELATTFRDDYKSFLRHCDIKLEIGHLDEENLERVHELTQRTNQMNFSGTRYDRDRLRAIMNTPHFDSYVLSCEDKFGSYGIVGFGLVDNRRPVLTDLMFSCRIQSKRVEHALLGHIIGKYRMSGRDGFHANYRKTSRNEPSGRVFGDLLMEERGTVEGITYFFFSYSREVPDDGIIEISLCNQGAFLGSRS